MVSATPLQLSAVLLRSEPHRECRDGPFFSVARLFLSPAQQRGASTSVLLALWAAPCCPLLCSPYRSCGRTLAACLRAPAPCAAMPGLAALLVSRPCHEVHSTAVSMTWDGRTFIRWGRFCFSVAEGSPAALAGAFLRRAQGPPQNPHSSPQGLTGWGPFAALESRGSAFPKHLHGPLESPQVSASFLQAGRGGPVKYAVRQPRKRR